jgi:hypothetical protein
MFKLRRVRLTEHVAHTINMRSHYKFFVGVPEVTRQLGKFKLRWEDNIKVDLKEIKGGI